MKETSETSVLPVPCLQPSRSLWPQSSWWLKGPRTTGTRLGSLINHDDDDNVKKQLVLFANQQLCTCISLFSTFLWRPLQDFHVKPRNVTAFYTGREHPPTNYNFLSFFEPWFTIILAWSSSLWRLVLSNRNIGQINYPSTAVQSALPSILSVIRSYTSVLLILIYTFPSCCLCKWFFQELFA